ncbi:four-carbon acid sugar kinase family protein [Schaalia vaccimaxillae]|uniref:four-carbon acid sugar kinase family protein n=1 Tax=Schaalia vaccimaxillae TaxID=183916 RepID=UPI0003B51412|nr:four-carbon acid sugar kinase family protein [Schaalia vaccimaxillae]
MRPITAQQVREAQSNARRNPVNIVLDDDPTGTQSVCDLPVLTSWEVHDFVWALETGKPSVYVMTNSRSLSPTDAERVNREVVKAALEASQILSIDITFISRSDSTLRGHFPLETNTIADVLRHATGTTIDGVILVPAFPEAGRISVHGIHYAGNAQSGYLPAAESEFAQDNTFGYAHSDFRSWVEEKSQGQFDATDVILIDIETLRTDPDATVDLLRSAHGAQPIAVDIVELEDMRALALALIRAEDLGSRFIYRVGPPFGRERIGQEIHPPLTPEEIHASRCGREATVGGLVVVGSHVGVTARQLDHLTQRLDARTLVIDSARIINDEDAQTHINELINEGANALDTSSVILRTSRALLSGFDAQTALAHARKISSAIVEVVNGIARRTSPRFVVAKGGITSSDVASKALEIRRARVIGPMLPGIVSMWSSQDGLAQGIPYIVFAGNVGTDQSLADVVEKLLQ